MLSIFSYWYIERPARNKNNKFIVIISLILILTSALVIFNFYIIQKDGIKNRLPDITGELKNIDGESCFGSYELCRFNSLQNKKVYIIGDSLMASLSFNLNQRLFKDYQFITANNGNCLYFPGFNKIDLKTKKKQGCNDDFFQKLKQDFSNNNISQI